MENLSSHLELLSLGVSSGHNWFVSSNIVESKLRKLLLKVVLVGNSVAEFREFFANFENPVSPVVCTLGVLHVVDTIVCHNQWILEILHIVCGSNSTKSMVVGSDPVTKGSFICGVPRVNYGGILELVLEVLWSVENNCILRSKSHDYHIWELSQHCLCHASLSQLLRGRSYLSLHVLGNSSCLPGAIVVIGQFTSPEDFQSWVASDLKSTTGVLPSLCTVNLGQGDWRIIGQQISCSLLKLRFESLAMATPGGVEHDQGCVQPSQSGVEVRVYQLQHVIPNYYCGQQA